MLEIGMENEQSSRRRPPSKIRNPGEECSANQAPLGLKTKLRETKKPMNVNGPYQGPVDLQNMRTARWTGIHIEHAEQCRFNLEL
jgi:hypothetical protein